MFAWPTQRSDSGGCGMRTRSPAFVRNPRCAASSVIRRRASSPSNGAQKNDSAAAVVERNRAGTTGARVRFAICPAAIRASTWSSRCGACSAERCGKVKRERLEFLADNPFYTKRFAYYVGRRCRATTIKDVAKELHLRLGHGQDAGEAVHARAAGQGGHARSQGDRHRRDLDPQGPHLSHRGERSDSRGARSGSAARTAPRRAWRCSTSGWARRRAAAFAWR